VSYEVWGDNDDPLMDSCMEQLLGDGWWDDDTVNRVKQAVIDLRKTQVYENGRKADGISVEFLMRLSILGDEVGIEDAFQPMVQEARSYFAEKERIAAANAIDVTPTGKPATAGGANSEKKS
jgi:hypothetical protein